MEPQPIVRDRGRRHPGTTMVPGGKLEAYGAGVEDFELYGVLFLRGVVQSRFEVARGRPPLPAESRCRLIAVLHRRLWAQPGREAACAGIAHDQEDERGHQDGGRETAKIAEGEARHPGEYQRRVRPRQSVSLGNRYGWVERCSGRLWSFHRHARPSVVSLISSLPKRHACILSGWCNPAVWPIWKAGIAIATFLEGRVRPARACNFCISGQLA